MLVVEDNQFDAIILGRALSESGLGINAHFVEDGQEAIDYLGGKGGFSDRTIYPLPRLVLLDLKMPRLNGFDVLNWIRETPQAPRLITVIFTSSDQEIDINRAYDLGANSYLRKPQDFSDFDRILLRTRAERIESLRLQEDSGPATCREPAT